MRKCKRILIETAKEICGTIRNNKSKRKTAWLTDKITGEVKIKKKTWQKYLSNGNDENYEIYREQRKHVKQLTTDSTQKSWTDFVDKLKKDSKGKHKLVFRVIKNLRNDKKLVKITIKSLEGEILTNRLTENNGKMVRTFPEFTQQWK